MSSEQFLQYLLAGITQGCIYALVGLGFTIIHAVTRIINFAQGEFVMLAGMLSFTLAVSAKLPLPLAVIISILAAAASGAVVYMLAIRTAKKASVISLIIITIGASILIRGIAAESWGVSAVRPRAFTAGDSISVGGAFITPQALWIIGTTIVVTILLHLLFSYTLIGKALKACSVNPDAASLVGVNPKMMAFIAFILAAAIGGIGGAVMAPLTLVSYSSGMMFGLKGFVAASLGGFSSQLITVAAGIMLGIVESLAIGLNWGPFNSEYKDAIALIVLLIVLLVRSGKLATEERAS